MTENGAKCPAPGCGRSSACRPPAPTCPHPFYASRPGKHLGEWPRCQSCGAPENDHPYRHPFKQWQPGRPTTSPGSERHQ